MKGVTN